MEEPLIVIGAKENNLKGVDVEIPKNKLTVITGISGSGKSSLAFNTIYAEGQRRYMETFTSYARQFIGDMKRPDVEEIKGLSPVISIEQKTTSKNPRSTVGTTTEIYDFLRLLYARIGEAYSHETGKPMIQYSLGQIIATIEEKYAGKKIVILAPLVKARKGHYRELFEQTRKKGYTKVRIDGVIMDIVPGMQVDRYKTHDIELVIDRVIVGDDKIDRITNSIKDAFKLGNDLVLINDIENKSTQLFSKTLMCADTGISYEVPSPNAFSFNSPYGACKNCNGLGEIHQVDTDKVIPDYEKTIKQSAIVPLGDVRDNSTFKQLRGIADKYDFTFNTKISDISKAGLAVILHGGDEELDVNNKFGNWDTENTLHNEGLINQLTRWYKTSSSESVRSWVEEFMHVVKCPSCNGSRLKLESRHFKLDDKNISEVANLDIKELYDWLEQLPKKLNKKQNLIAKEVLKELKARVGFLKEVGLSYLMLNRGTRSLSGGEAQRIRLATQIGSQLTGITYILDEPSIGLHQRDNDRLIGALKNLSQIGNTVIVVEHDKDIMNASDYIIDIGPGAGVHGGEVVSEGSPKIFRKTKTNTAKFLSGENMIEVPKEYRKSEESIKLTGCTGNNLKNVDLEIPLGILTCVTGVSGSGKSTLINGTLYPIIRKHLYKSIKKPYPYKNIEGIDLIDKVIDIDQSPIGRTPRSNAATYIGVFTDIRKLFSITPEAKIRGYKIGRFSFNVKGGRCESCQGGGQKVIEMNFLPDVYVKCDTCQGKRYNNETLEILYKGKSIYDVLEMTVEEAVEFFKPVPSIFRKINTLKDVGLGYIRLGQPATTLSGGEAQRVKLAEELSKKATGKTLYILDEPTTGLHFSDIKQLLGILQKLVDKGNTVLVIEHNMDVIKIADHIIDVGPEGGKHGGKIIFGGTPKELVKEKNSHTGKFLKLEFES